MTVTTISLAGLVIAMGAAGAMAQDWPDKPVTMIVPYNPGGLTDNLARMAAEAIAADIGQPVVVENRPGAGGLIGATMASRAAADGYTIFFGNNATNVIQPLINEAVTYDPQADFTGVGTIADTASFLAVGADNPSTTVPEFLDWLKASPQSKYGTAGIGSMGQFTTELLLASAGATATHIPYQGSADAMASVMSGEIAFITDPVVATQPESDRMRIIATLTPARFPNLPEVPTAREQGVDVVISGWFGVFAPAGTPADAIARMSGALEALVASDAYEDQVLRMGVLPFYRDGAALDQAVAEDLVIFGKIRDDAGISIQ